LLCFGSLQHRLGDYQTAMLHFTSARDIAEKGGSARLRSLAVRAVNGVGRVHEDLGEYARAEAAYRLAIRLRGLLRGDEHLDTALELHSLGNLFATLGDFEGAERALRQALDVRTRTCGDMHPAVATTSASLGVLRQTIGDHAAAQDLLVRALEILRSVPGQSHPEAAEALASLGLLPVDT